MDKKTNLLNVMVAQRYNSNQIIKIMKLHTNYK